VKTTRLQCNADGQQLSATADRQAATAAAFTAVKFSIIVWRPCVRLQL